MDLLPTGAYGINSIDADTDIQGYGQRLDRTLGVSDAFAYDTTKDWPETLKTTGSTSSKPTLDSLQKTQKSEYINKKAPVDLLTGNRTDAAVRQTSKKIVLIQAQPFISHDEDEDPSSGRGDFTLFEASLSRESKPFGSLTGTIETFDIVTGRDDLEVRLRTLIFELPKGQLVAQGSSTYTTGPDFVPLNVNDPVVIAITGGTGAYIGATGEVRTTRRADGTYRQVITLLQDQRSGRTARNNKD
jgi:hypothetical protein